MDGVRETEILNRAYPSPAVRSRAENEPGPWAGPAWRRKYRQSVMFALFRAASVVNGVALLIIVLFLVAKGYRAINWT
ncbi:MAG: hypothetical protein JW821_03405, partial [Deltaproteobacteria bacterium]|nr:hypothetical protein [Deltaproteobacteria bacterium]